MLSRCPDRGQSQGEHHMSFRALESARHARRGLAASWPRCSRRRRVVRPRRSVAGASDTIDVSGTVLVLAGEAGERTATPCSCPPVGPSRWRTGSPLSRCRTSSARSPFPAPAPDARLTGSLRASALRRAESSRTPLKVARARVAAAGAVAGPDHPHDVRRQGDQLRSRDRADRCADPRHRRRLPGLLGAGVRRADPGVEHGHGRRCRRLDGELVRRRMWPGCRGRGLRRCRAERRRARPSPASTSPARRPTTW